MADRGCAIRNTVAKSAVAHASERCGGVPLTVWEPSEPKASCILATRCIRQNGLDLDAHTCDVFEWSVRMPTLPSYGRRHRA